MNCRYRCTFRGLLAGTAMLVVLAAPVHAQGRVIETHTFDEPEGRLLAFYSAALAFSPAGFAGTDRLWVGVEASYIPWLDEARRRPSIDKPEVTNLAPAFPRPRIGLRLGAVRLEGSWIPPVRVFDVEANVVAGAVALEGWQFGELRVAPRVWGTTGRVRGTITCAASAMLGHGSALEAYYTFVCHGNESDDWFEPRSLGGELLVSRTFGAGGFEAYAAAGGRVDRTRFDIGVIRPDGSRDPDHPVLTLRATRPHLVAGATWTPAARLGAGAEVFYAPGSLLTGRVSVRWRVRP